MRVVPLAVLQQFIAKQKEHYDNACGDSAIGWLVADELQDLVNQEAIGGRDVW